MNLRVVECLCWPASKIPLVVACVFVAAGVLTVCLPTREWCC